MLRPGATLAVYDVMRYPVPWASDAATSVLGDLESYERALSAAGFGVVAVEDRREFAIEYFADMKARTAEHGGPPPIGLSA